VAGANKVGAISVWLNRESKPNNSTIIADYEIKSLDELTDILKV
jgi:FMN phosphatase YigB (HAD superfamily)